MSRFLIGLVVGAIGCWVYDRLSGGQPPLPTQTSDLVTGGLSSVGLGQAGAFTSEGGSSGGTGPLVRPTPQEVAGRPSEPFPGPAATTYTP